MPGNEKEFNGNLFDQLTILDDIEEVAEQENATKTLAMIAKKRGQIMRKLYQNPPMPKDE
jgi:tRNA(Ser,Leu) C12 N-acetylase TAN1